MRKSALIGLYWKAIGWFALFGLAMAAYLAGCAALMASMHGMTLGGFVKTPAMLHSVPLIVLAGIGYLATVLGLNVVMRVYLLRDLWSRVIASTTVHGIEAEHRREVTDAGQDQQRNVVHQRRRLDERADRHAVHARHHRRASGKIGRHRQSEQQEPANDLPVKADQRAAAAQGRFLVAPRRTGSRTATSATPPPCRRRR